MTSNIARDTVEQLKAEGLAPTFDDIIRLNALGLKVERTDGADRGSDLAALPRVAFLGDNVLQEPTVAKRIWLDMAAQVIGGSYFTLLCLCAFALWEDAARLPSCNDAKALRRSVEAFRDRVLIGSTVTEIEAAVDYALRGNDPTRDEDPEATVAEKEAAKRVRELPEAVASTARTLLLHAAGFGIQKDVAESVTCPQLERMIAVAAMIKGANVADGEKNRATADFYRTADAIKERLLKERNHG